MGSSCGGTLRATFDMVRALPDCEHSIRFVRGGPDREALREMEELGIQLWAAGDKPDLTVCQNSDIDHIPATGELVVYYAHSATAAARKLPKRVDLKLCVSQWLARKIGWGLDTVLYQPVSVLPRIGGRTEKLTIGRICTPSSRKWKAADWVPYFEPVFEAYPDVQVDLVGIPTKEWGDLPSWFKAKHVVPSPAERVRFHWWDILLYTSSMEESFGRTVREAQRCGCFPIVSDRGGFVEQIDVTSKTDWGPGHLIRHPDETVEIIRKWEQNKEYLRTMCQTWGDKLGSLQAWRGQFLQRLKTL